MAEFSIPGPSFDRKESSPAGSLRAIIRRAKAEAWDEGYAAGQIDYECAAENPHREENADG